MYNPAATYESVRFTLAANFTGLPAIVLPAGRQMGSALPIGYATQLLLGLGSEQDGLVALQSFGTAGGVVLLHLQSLKAWFRQATRTSGLCQQSSKPRRVAQSSTLTVTLLCCAA